MPVGIHPHLKHQSALLELSARSYSTSKTLTHLRLFSQRRFLIFFCTRSPRLKLGTLFQIRALLDYFSVRNPEVDHHHTRERKLLLTPVSLNIFDNLDCESFEENQLPTQPLPPWRSPTYQRNKQVASILRESTSLPA